LLYDITAFQNFPFRQQADGQTLYLRLGSVNGITPQWYCNKRIKMAVFFSARAVF